MGERRRKWKQHAKEKMMLNGAFAKWNILGGMFSILICLESAPNVAIFIDKCSQLTCSSHFSDSANLSGDFIRPCEQTTWLHTCVHSLVIIEEIMNKF